MAVPPAQEFRMALRDTPPANNVAAGAELADRVGDVIVVLDGTWRISYANRAAADVAGRPKQELLGCLLWDACPGLLGTAAEEACRRAMGGRLPAHSAFPVNVGRRSYDLDAYPAGDGLAVYGRDVTDRACLQATLRQNQERFRAHLEGVPVPAYVWRRSGEGRVSGDAFKLVSFNGAAARFTRGAVASLVGAWAGDLYADEPGILEAMRGCADERVVIRRDMPYRMRSTGETKDLEVSYAFLPPNLVVIHTVDVTERRRAERSLDELTRTFEHRVAERTASLAARCRRLEAAEGFAREQARRVQELADHNHRRAREIEHRLGNQLAGLLALIREVRRRGGGRRGLPEVGDAVEGHLVALTHVHRLLTATGWRPLAWRGLVESLLAAIGPASPHPCATTVAGPDAPVDERQATGLALILTEWFTNSCKYGAHSIPGGRLDVSGELMPAPGGGCGSFLRLTWTERGGPPVRAPFTPSLGTELVRAFAARELRGRCTLAFPAGGVEHALEFPVSSPAAGAAATMPPPPRPARE